MELFSNAKSMETSRTKQFSVYREFSTHKEDMSCHVKDDWESHDDTEVQLDHERVHQLDWWRHCKELMGPLDDAFERMIPSIVKPLELELKSLPEDLKYGYLGENNTLSIIISTRLSAKGETTLLPSIESS